MNKAMLILMVSGCVASMSATAAEADDAASSIKDKNAAMKEFMEIRDAYLAVYKPLSIEDNRAWWTANITGSDEDFAHKAKADEKLVELHSDSARFARLKALRASGEVTDNLMARELDVMYRAHLANQADPALLKKAVAIENEVEQIFNTHRSEVGDKKLTENEVRSILRDGTDSAKAQAAWTGYISVGRKVEGKLRDVVKLRNQIARQLGFRDFYDLKLTEQEVDETQLIALFDELDALTREPFTRLKADIDKKMAKRFGIEESQLRPWHFGDIFFQEAPQLGEVDLDAVYADADLLKLTTKYYASMGLACDDVVARSDLYEKEGKSPHAFCIDLDRAGDIRVLANIKPTLQWADTVMHEFGHSVYDKYIDKRLPFLLHDAAHSITTEGIAMMFGAMVKNEDYLIKVRGLDPAEAHRIVAQAEKSLRAEKLIFSRWSQVMVRFERAMYANPDQDLAKLWWDLKKKYQLINPPDDLSLPGYAAKVHILTAPVYYHSYLMGDLFGCQVRSYIARKILNIDDPGSTCLYDQPKAGKFLREEVFGPGARYPWNELTRLATGEPLTARYFANLYVN